MWKNTVQLSSSHMTLTRMRIVCWLPKAKNTHSEYVILTAFTLQQWLKERASMLLHSTLSVLFITVRVFTARYETNLYLLSNLFLGVKWLITNMRLQSIPFLTYIQLRLRAAETSANVW